jgi:hypothetical protein
MTALRAILVAATGVFAILALPAQASATPGQCWNSPFGGFCDQMPAADGSFMHCEHTGFGSSTYQNCFQVCMDASGRTYPTDYNVNTPC